MTTTRPVREQQIGALPPPASPRRTTVASAHCGHLLLADGPLPTLKENLMMMFRDGTAMVADLVDLVTNTPAPRLAVRPAPLSPAPAPQPVAPATPHAEASPALFSPEYAAAIYGRRYRRVLAIQSAEWGAA